MFVLASTAADVCEPGQSICTFFYNRTGNETIATLSNDAIGIPLALLGYLVLGLALRWGLHKLVGRLIHRASSGVMPERITAHNSAASARRGQRAETMGSLLKSIITGILAVIIATMMLSEIGVNIAPIIASAGIVGVALGFGAQSLVKDFLSGVFMIFEDQFGVGDIVDLGEATGTVEAVTLRITRLRDINGTVWYVPNGEVLRVGNQSQNWSRTVLDVGVSYSADLAEVRRVLQDVAHDLWEDDDFKGQIIEEPAVWGVQDLAADAVTIRVVLKTTPGAQWAVAREMRQRIKGRFDHEGIEIPFPQRVVWTRGDQPTEPVEQSPDRAAEEPVSP